MLPWRSAATAARWRFQCVDGGDAKPAHGAYKVAWCETIDFERHTPPEDAVYYRAVLLELADTVEAARAMSSRSPPATQSKEKKKEKAHAAKGQGTNWDKIMALHTKAVRKNPAFREAVQNEIEDKTQGDACRKCEKLHCKYETVRSQKRALEREVEELWDLIGNYKDHVSIQSFTACGN